MLAGPSPEMLSSMRPVHVAVVSTYPPRRCGIASFAFDLRTELVGVPGIEDVCVTAVVEESFGPRLPEVVSTIRQEARDDYVRAALHLGSLDVDVVLLQHEYGIFGGADGDYILPFTQQLAQPFVVTLHTVLSEPSPHQLHVLSTLCEQATLVIVMTDTATRLLVEAGACQARKVRVVPHGAPALLGRIAEHSADRLASGSRETDAHERLLLTTFGLISPGKGLEMVIKALPFVVREHPEVRYLIGGPTHPGVAKHEGEGYRRQLEHHVAVLGLGSHVEFDDRFLSIEELADLLASTDIFITPYRNRDQISSGTLTFAIAAGCAVISTPYWYAQDMLASGAGRLVPFDDPQALAKAICQLIDDPEALAAARAEARRIGAGLAWPAVAKSTAAALFDAALADETQPDCLRTDRLLPVRPAA